jgi:pimeloyl-ACP methyl ester carboxylesterase
MPWLTRDGIRLHYEIHGAGNGRCPVLLAHGMASTSRSWAPNLDEAVADFLATAP